MAPLEPGSVLAGYRVEGVVARGGMGVVYRATQLALDRPVALKVIAPEVADDPAFRARFGRESRLAASIDHANVIPVHEAGEAGGLLYITMRLVDGIDLGRMIARDGPLEPVRAAGVIGQVAAALDAAHARGLVHRDVKPANVLVAGDGHVYLTDFGLVKSIDSDSGPTQTGQVVGTVNYVAPEQIHGSAADARADVYALGCLTFQVLTGELPFARETPVATMWAHSHDPPPRIGEQRPELAAVDEVLARALAKDPAERFPSAGDLARALSASVAGEHVAAPERSVARGEAAGEATQGLPSLATAALAGGPATPATRPETPDDESTAERSAPASGERGGRRVLLIAGAILLVLTAGIVALQLAAGAGTGKAHDALAAKTLSITPIALRGGPRGVAVGEGGVWVSNNDAGTVSEIDPGSNTVTGKPVTVGQGPDAIAAGEGYVWVVAGNDGRLFRIDPGSHEVTGAPIEVGYGAGEVATGGGYVWVADSSDDAVLRIDPKANRVVGKPIAVPTGVGGALAIGEGYVWVTNDSSTDTISRIDMRTGRVAGTPVAATGQYSGDVAAGAGFGWGYNGSDAVLTRLDARTGRASGRPLDTGGGSGAIAVGGGAVWILDEPGAQLRRVDPATNRLSGAPARVDVSNESRLAIGDDAAWVTSPEGGTLTRVGF